MTQKIKVTAEMEIEEDIAIDGLSLDTSLGLLGTIKSYDVKYEEKKKEEGPKLTYDQIKEKYFVLVKVSGSVKRPINGIIEATPSISMMLATKINKKTETKIKDFSLNWPYKENRISSTA